MNKNLYNPNPELQKTNGSILPKTALIVDDESDICILLSNILKQANIQPVLAGSIGEAEEKLRSPNPFCYIFLDNFLPDGLGINQVKKWKEKHPEAHLIMITAHDSFEERNKARGDGADHFISKPFTKEKILNTIVQTSD